MEFVEGDELHPKANIEKISSGRPLNDQDREPWLKLIRETMERRTVQRPQPEGNRECYGLIVTCSALKRDYRELLRGRRKSVCSPENAFTGAQKQAESVATYFVYVKGRKELILQRLQERKGHYMKSNMLDSQFEVLECPEGEGDVVVVDADDDIRGQMDKTKEKIMAVAGDWFSKCF
jgi:gluconokinase